MGTGTFFLAWAPPWRNTPLSSAVSPVVTMKRPPRGAIAALSACCMAMVLPGVGMPLVLTLFRYYGRECSANELSPFSATGLSLARGRLDDAQREALRTVLASEVPSAAQGYCGVDCSVLNQHAKQMRHRCKVSVTSLQEQAPAVVATLEGLLNELGLPAQIEDPHFVPIYSPAHLNASSPLPPGFGWLRAFAPPEWVSVALSMAHQAHVMYDSRRNFRTCSEAPLLCQGFPWHIDDEDLAPRVVNRLYVLIDNNDSRRSNLRVVPRGALSRFALDAMLARAGWREWQRAAMRMALESSHSAYARVMGAGDADYFARQIRFSLAGCTAVMEPGDVLLFSSDIYHQTQGAESDRLTLIVSSCENCDAVPTPNAPLRLSTSALRERPRPLRTATGSCEPWCANACAELSGDAALECGGCDAKPGVRCHPQALDFPGSKVQRVPLTRAP